MVNKILGYDIDNRSNFNAFSDELAVDLHNAIHDYITKGTNKSFENKANAFDYLNKLIYTEYRGDEFNSFIDILNEEEGTTVVWACGVDYDDSDFLLVALHKPYTMKIELYTFDIYETSLVVY